MSDGPAPEAWLLEHKFIVNKQRSDGKICMSNPVENHEDYSNPEKLFSAETIQEEIDQVKKEMTLDLNHENSENWNATVRKFAENLKQSFDKDTLSKDDNSGETE